VVTRRGLLAAGGALLLAGCGKPPSGTVAPTDALEGALRAQAGAFGAYEGLRGPKPVSSLASRAHARVNALLAAVRSRHGTPTTPPATPGTPTLETALDAEHRALQATVAAVGKTTDHAVRALLADAIVSNARSEAQLLQLLGRDPLANPFPGEPA
jgi:hypothetical protein